MMTDIDARPKYPTHVEDVPYGKALVADRDLEAGTIVEKFEGKIVEYDDLSDYDKTYVLNYLPKGSSEWKWLLPLSNARYANHSCDPSAYINDKQELILRKPVREGDQITFLYNPGDESEWWDPVWNFKCCCGSKQCQGMIDRYRKSTLEN